MIAALLAIMATIALSPPFGEVSATAVDDGSYIVVTVTVDLEPGFDADYLVAHLLNPDGQETFTLGQVADDRYVGSFTILPFNRALVFEVGRAEEFTLSETLSLIDLGLDADQLRTTFQTPRSTAGTSKWGWLALGAGTLAGAVLLVYWVWPKPRKSEASLVDTSGGRQDMCVT